MFWPLCTCEKKNMHVFWLSHIPRWLLVCYCTLLHTCLLNYIILLKIWNLTRIKIKANFHWYVKWINPKKPKITMKRQPCTHIFPQATGQQHYTTNFTCKFKEFWDTLQYLSDVMFYFEQVLSICCCHVYGFQKIKAPKESEITFLISKYSSSRSHPWIWFTRTWSC